MTLGMSRIITIKELARDGLSVAAIAETVGVSWETAKKYVDMEDFSWKPPRVGGAGRSKLDEHAGFIDEILLADKKVHRKQRHTARDIHRRLVAECGVEVSERTVNRYVARRRVELGDHQVGAVELTWPPGEAQVDFGDVDVVEGSKVVRRHMLVVSFPYSNVGFVQLFGGQTAECVVQGLKDVFTHIGGVPTRVVFDNATGIGRRRGEDVLEAELFKRFRLHYGFEATYCNPASGNEKGNVERKVFFARHRYFVPMPTVTNMTSFNEDLLVACDREEKGRTHYAKERSGGELFADDVVAMIPLPTLEFQSVRYERVRTDGWGGINIGKHHYSGVSSHVRRDVIVQIGAHHVELTDPATTTVLTTHKRAWGDEPTRSIDIVSQLEQLTVKPRGFRSAAVRAHLPRCAVAALDELGPVARGKALSDICAGIATHGEDAMIEALETVGLQGDGGDFAAASVLAARICSIGIDTAPLPGPDLAVYDLTTVGEGK